MRTMMNTRLKAAIKEEHNALQKREVFTRVHCSIQRSDYTPQQLKDVIQTKWVVRSRPGGKQRKRKARFVAKGYTHAKGTSQTTCDMSDIQSAFLNTPIQHGTTILVKPPPECATNDDSLWKLY
eukprot:4134612-Amphidinium_carterae.2